MRLCIVHKIYDYGVVFSVRSNDNVETIDSSHESNVWKIQQQQNGIKIE